MNPLLDIMTTIGPANPIIAGTGAAAPSGDKTDGLFASVLTAAVQQATGQVPADLLTALSAAGEPPTAVDPETAADPTKVTATAGPVIPTLIVAETDPEIPATPQPHEQGPTPEPQLINLAAAAVIINPTQDSAQPTPQAAAELILPQSETNLASAVSLLLTPDVAINQTTVPTAQLPADVTINSTESLSNDELAAILVSSTPSDNRPAHVATTTAPKNPAAAVSGQLKATLQKQFPELNIQSGSGKLAVDLNVKAATNSTPETPAIAAPVQAVAVASLPIAHGFRVVKDLATKPTARVETSPGNRPAVQILDEAETPATPATDKMTARILNTAPKQLEIAKLTAQAETANREAVTTFEVAGSAATAFEKPEAIAVSTLDETTFTKTPDAEPAKISVQRVQIETLLKRGEIKLQIQPEHLGMVKIRLLTTPHETTARLETSSEDARRAVELGLPQLRESFERAGLKLSQIEVVVGDDSLSRHSQTFNRNPRQPRPDAKRMVAPVAELASLSSASGAAAGSVGLLSGLNLLA